MPEKPFGLRSLPQLFRFWLNAWAALPQRGRNQPSVAAHPTTLRFHNCFTIVERVYETGVIFIRFRITPAA